MLIQFLHFKNIHFKKYKSPEQQWKGNEITTLNHYRRVVAHKPIESREIPQYSL